MQRIEKVQQAWEMLSPGHEFAGMTLGGFQQAIAASRQVRERICQLESVMSGLIQERAVADARSHALATQVIHAVLAMPDTSERDRLYRAMGFIPGSERASGLTRRKKNASRTGGAPATRSPLTSSTAASPRE